jgi:hypothetical protein
MQSTETQETPIKKDVLQNTWETPERFKMSEMGYLGLRHYSGVTRDEIRRELNFPQSLVTYREMGEHSTINASLSLFDSIISKATWSFKPPKDATDEEKKQAEAINQMMHDMDTSWTDFIRDALSMNVYGFSLCEKVYRRRYKSNGSLYNDGIVGWKKLPIRSQESIQRFIFSSDGNELLGAKQNLTRISDNFNQYMGSSRNEVVLPMSKLLHFRSGRHRGDPYGKSPLRDAYLAWKYLVLLEEMETTGVSKDLAGLPVLSMPMQYLDKDADVDKQAVRKYFENAMRNLQMNEQSAMILPNMYDPDTKQPLFKLDLLSTGGNKSYDITKIKEWYKNLIMISLSTDILTMGQTQVGSFALGSIKNSFAGSVAHLMARNIADTLNRDLIRQTYELNQWDTSRMGTIDFGNLIEVDMEVQSKFLQRVMSVGLMEADREALNAVRSAAGLEPLDDTLPPQEDLMIHSSKSGSGLATGTDNGTSTSVAGTDNSSMNLDNSA